MKRQQLVKLLSRNHCVLHRHGANHDIFINVTTGRKAPVPRHGDVKDTLVKLILKQLDIENP